MVNRGLTNTLSFWPTASYFPAMSMKLQTTNVALRLERLNSARRALETEASGMTELIVSLTGALGAAIADAVELISASKGRVIISGMGKSGHVGRKIASTLASTGTPAMFVHPAEASHGDLGMITTQDVVVMLSNSGESAELLDILNYTQRFAVPLIAMTTRADSSLGRAADIVLLLPQPVRPAPMAWHRPRQRFCNLPLVMLWPLLYLRTRDLRPKISTSSIPAESLGRNSSMFRT